MNFLHQLILQFLEFIYFNIAFRNLGLTVILLTIFIRIILLPVFYKGTKNQIILQRMQPMIKKIQKQHKDNREEQTKALMGLYREHKINPFSSIFLLLIQLPILIVLFRVFLGDLTEFENYQFLFFNLRERSFFLAGLTSVLQYLQTKFMTSSPPAGSLEDKMQGMNKAMLYFFSGFTFIVLTTLPSVIAIYWLTGTVFTIFSQIYINKKLNGDIGKNKKVS